MSELPALDGHFGLSFAEYLEDPGYSCSTLLDFRRSPAYARHRMMNPTPSTDAQRFGSAVHCLALEGPEAFNARYDVARPCAGKTKSGKSCGSIGSIVSPDGEWYCRVSGHAPPGSGPPLKTILPPGDFDRALRMGDAIDAHPLWRAWRWAGDTEVSVFAERNGIRVKARPDYIGNGYIVDLKTTARIDAWPWEVRRRGYDVRAAWYLDVCRRAGLDLDGFAYLVVASDEPHEVYSWRVEDRWLEEGRAKLGVLWAQILTCHRSIHWPGGNARLESMPLPEEVGGAVSFADVPIEEEE